MNRLVSRIKPKSGVAHVVHLALTALLPALMYVFVRINFEQIALALILISKWRMLAVRPRHWWPNIRANAIDIIVGLSFLTFMTNTIDGSWQLFWAGMYGLWLLFIKPRSDTVGVSAQAMIGQLCGMMALFIGWQEAPLFGLVLTIGLICYVSARHFFTSYDEPYTAFFSHTWGYFGAALTWVLGHWLLFYGVVAQPTLLLTVIGFGLATIYYLDHRDKLSTLLRRQFIFLMVAVVAVILVFSDWGDKSI
jgi:hypothetical protein